MLLNRNKIALGGGCHWCTEAVFQALKGVVKVEQGYVASVGQDTQLSEAVIVYYLPHVIPLKVLLEVHLYTHKSTSNHSMRSKYRSAVYFYSEAQEKEVLLILEELKHFFNKKIITKTLPFKAFVASREAIQNYYISNPKRPFCVKFIAPKLELIQDKFSKYSSKNVRKL